MMDRSMIFMVLMVGFGSAGLAQAASAAGGWDAPFGAEGLVVGSVEDLVIFGGDLVAGGSFKLRGETETRRVARWNGEGWEILGEDPDGPVEALAVHGGELIAGGRFTAIGERSFAHIARWDGEAWQPLGGGLNGPVFALTTHDGALVAGGAFTEAGGRPAAHLARWNGKEWHDLGDAGSQLADATPTAAPITALADYRGTLVASDGSIVYSWREGVLSRQPLDTKTQIRAFADYDGRLLIGGGWSRVNGQHAKGLVSWYSPEMSMLPLGSGVDHRAGEGRRRPAIHDLAVFDGELIVTGDFTRAGGVEARRIARWNGVRWAALGGGLDRPGNALLVHDGDLIVGGEFTQAGDAPAGLVARWREAR